MMQDAATLTKRPAICRVALGMHGRIQVSAFSNHLHTSRHPIGVSVVSPSYSHHQPAAFPMKIVTMLLLACALGSVSEANLFAARVDSVAAPSSTGIDPQKTVAEKFDAFNRHDADTIESLYATDASLHSPDHPELIGNTKIADTYRWIFAAIPDARDTISSIESTGNNVYVQFVLTGHLKDAENKAVNVRIMSVYTIMNHRIVSDSTYYDRKTP
ncbi:nuclear transport factor 2 family protein [Dyella sp. 20L07]|uniref:nuclear transport factor 2 family protein n=1 Tax=Dyella sp. 20L07 TaxID=3384240 RepID=UPI003D2C4779